MDETAAVHNAIWNNIPELRDTLIAFERKSVENALGLGIEPHIGPYAQITDVLMWSHIQPMLEIPESNREKFQHSADAIEQTLEAKNSFLDEAVGIRIVERLLLPPERWRRFREFAGPLLKAEALKSSEFFPWPYDEPVV